MPENRAALEFIYRRWGFTLGASLDGIFNDAQQVRFYHLLFTVLYSVVHWKLERFT